MAKLRLSKYKSIDNIKFHPNIAVLVVQTQCSIWKASFFNIVHFYFTFLVRSVKKYVNSVKPKIQCLDDLIVSRNAFTNV